MANASEKASEAIRASDISKAEEKAKQNHAKVFVLKAKPNGLKSAENFLKNRTWDLVSSTDMKTALATLFRQSIDYAMIGVDHPHPHVLKLPEIIAQTIKIPVILFAENLSPQASQMLRAAKHPYVLFPPVSGPAIERMLLRIEKDKQSQALAKTNEEKNAEANQAESQTSFRVSEGQRTSSENSQINGKFSMEEIAKLFEGDALSPVMSATQAGAGMGTAMSQMQSGFGTGKLKSQMEAGNMAGQSMSSMQAGNMAGQSTSSTELSNNGLPASARHASSIDLSLWPEGPSRKKNEQTGDPSIATELMDNGGYNRQIAHQSILLDGTEHALSKSVLPSPGASKPVPLSKNSNVGCFSIESAGVAGVIVVAFGDDLVIDEKFSDDLRNHLVSFMQENGIGFSIDDMMKLKIQQVEFEQWSEKEALFLRKSIHAGSELAIAFFINEEAQGPLEVSVHTHMLKVNIDEIRTDNSLDFDVYLYFPENQKYIRYVGKDGNLSGPQWDRLTARGVTEVHVKKEAAGEYSRYRMKNFLNDKITTYQTRKKPA